MYLFDNLEERRVMNEWKGEICDWLSYMADAHMDFLLSNFVE